jgi:hypothetical protein
MITLEFTEQVGDDGLLQISIPVDAAGKRYHVVVHVEPEEVDAGKLEYLSDEFINETAGQWVGDFPMDSEGSYEKREPL